MLPHLDLEGGGEEASGTAQAAATVEIDLGKVSRTKGRHT
jgi:hypothetical protein